jgi:hypothetical protein
MFQSAGLQGLISPSRTNKACSATRAHEVYSSSSSESE